MSHVPAFASSTILPTAVYSMNATGRPDWRESSRPSSTVVPVSAPVDLSFDPMTGLPVNTATRSVPVGASSERAAAEGAGAGDMPAHAVTSTATASRPRHVDREMARDAFMAWILAASRCSDAMQVEATADVEHLASRERQAPQRDGRDGRGDLVGRSPS